MQTRTRRNLTYPSINPTAPDNLRASASELTEDELAAGFPPRPALNLRYFGGRTITHLVFANHYLGGSAAWAPADIASIDAALAKAMSDNDLQSVIQQYYDAPISSRMLPSMVLPGSAPATIYKDQVETVVARICRHGALDGAEMDSTVIYILLPRGVVLVDGFSPGFRPLPGQEAEHKRRQHAVVKVGGQDADSRHGLGGYHGSARVTPCGTAYYAVGVYSEAGNGIPIFDQPWKNVAATIYHQLNEARTDPDVGRRHPDRRQRQARLVLRQGRRDRRHPGQGSRQKPRSRVPRRRPGRRLRRRPGPAHVVQQGRSPRLPAPPSLRRYRMAPAAAPAGTVRSQHH